MTGNFLYIFRKYNEKIFLYKRKSNLSQLINCSSTKQSMKLVARLWSTPKATCC